MAFNPFKKGDWDKLGKQGKDEFNKIANALEGRGRGPETRAAQGGGGLSQRRACAMGREVEDGLRKSAHEITDAFEKELPKPCSRRPWAS